jgi:hypothetical protein
MKMNDQFVCGGDFEMSRRAAAIQRVKRNVDARQYQLFDLHVSKKWPATRVARALNTHLGQVYMAKHRINHMIRRELGE